MLHKLEFLPELRHVFKWLEKQRVIITALLIAVLGIGLYFALIASPEDYQQGDSVRIMYIHVPAAWMAMGIYSLITMASISSFIWKNQYWFITAHAAAPIGMMFTLLCMITGAIWGKPTWGAWWVWDARLTSVFILFFIYLGYYLLALEAHANEAFNKIAAVFAIVGAINLPIIKFSVEWWNTLHQPASVTRFDAPAIHSSMLTPLFIMFAAYVLFFIIVLTLQFNRIHLMRKISRLESTLTT